MLRTMIRDLVRKTSRFLEELHRAWPRRRPIEFPEPSPLPDWKGKFDRLHKVTLTDEVSRTLFEEFTSHRDSSRGHEETGWVLLGLREEHEAVVLATLPAGTESNAGVAHVRFNSSGQVLGSRIVRQMDRRLTMLGVVHTHPGSMRHPSDGDYQGDILWVKQLRGGEGIFGIGTADANQNGETLFGQNPKANLQCWGPLCFSWYSLRYDDNNYRPLRFDLTLGPDLANPLHPIWPTIENHADRVDRLCRQQAKVYFEVVSGQEGTALALNLPLADPGNSLRVLLEGKEVRYYLFRQGQVLAADLPEFRVDQGVYLLLAELAAQG